MNTLEQHARAERDFSQTHPARPTDGNWRCQNAGPPHPCVSQSVRDAAYLAYTGKPHPSLRGVSA